MTVSFALKPHIASTAACPRYEFFGSAVKILASGEETDGVYSLTEHLLPAGSGTPPHVHHYEDESFYILEGEVTIWCGDTSYLARAGDFAFLPRDVRHSFVNTGAGDARMLVLTNPAGFEQFIAEAGVPTRSDAIPPMPEDAELGRIMTEIAPKYGIELLVYA
jgi:mannose-6-phosphate isomerase-like protein (cupin superfamily)